METFMGFITPFPWSFAPRDWSEAAGQLIPISQNTALFSLIGTTYGGDGRTTFALPDMRGRTPIGMGNGPGLSSRILGQHFGSEISNISLTSANLPPHTHTLSASDTAAATLAPTPVEGWTLGAAATASGRPVEYTPVNMYNASTPATPVQSAPTSSAGNGSPVTVSNMQPSLCLNFCIALQGLYPSRN